ncbi:MAG: sigma-70 family RNA polymerase sigma factor [Gemmatimonadetes bacterium]|nr:MAG: sigma-70 family RNA polymerase sigma factor [Gemmatimonadota bacterium]
MTDRSTRVAAFEACRARLFGIAYRMLGERDAAEDVVQETWLRYARSTDVRDAEAWLVRVATRLAIDQLRVARARRDAYPGPWLPEPLPTGPDPARDLDRAEALSLALLAALERLSPLERAVFLLREAFGYGYADIAAIVGRRQDHCRQVGRRARTRVRDEARSVPADPEAHARLLETFLSAAAEGDLATLESLLAEDVELVSDGGGRVAAARRPLHGRDAVTRFLVGVAAKAAPDTTGEVTLANGEPVAVVREDGAPVVAVAIAVADGRIRRVFMVRNPDKLRGFA